MEHSPAPRQPRRSRSPPPPRYRYPPPRRPATPPPWRRKVPYSATLPPRMRRRISARPVTSRLPCQRGTGTASRRAEPRPNGGGRPAPRVGRTAGRCSVQRLDTTARERIARFLSIPFSFVSFPAPPENPGSARPGPAPATCRAPPSSPPPLVRTGALVMARDRHRSRPMGERRGERRGGAPSGGGPMAGAAAPTAASRGVAAPPAALSSDRRGPLWRCRHRLGVRGGRALPSLLPSLLPIPPSPSPSPIPGGREPRSVCPGLSAAAPSPPQHTPNRGLP